MNCFSKGVGKPDYKFTKLKNEITKILITTSSRRKKIKSYKLLNLRQHTEVGVWGCYTPVLQKSSAICGFSVKADMSTMACPYLCYGALLIPVDKFLLLHSHSKVLRHATGLSSQIRNLMTLTNSCYKTKKCRNNVTRKYLP